MATNPLEGQASADKYDALFDQHDAAKAAGKPSSNPYLDDLREVEAARKRATSVGPDKYDGLMDGYDALRRRQMTASTTLAADTNPDQYAAARKAAQQMGYPVAVAEALPAEVQREARIRTVQTDAAASPTLQRKYTDADFARLAHDDSGVLSALGAAARYITSADDKRGLTNDIAAGYYQAQAGTAGALRAVTDIAAYPLDFLEGVTAIGGNPLRRLAEGWGQIAQANMADQQRSASQFEGNFGQGVSSGVQSLTGNALTLPLALLPGGQPAALAAMSAQAGGQSYQNSREKGVGQVQSLVYGLSDAVIEYGTEKLPLSRLIESVKAGAGPLATFAKTFGQEVRGELIATTLQNMNEWAVLNPDKPFSAYAAELPDAWAQTVVATLIGTGGNVTISHAMQRVADNAMDIQRGENAGLGLQQMLALAAQSKLRERSPDQFADMVNGMAQDANAPSELRFDARTLAEALSQSGLDINQVLPSAAAQLEEAIATGGEITVPIGEYAANVVGTDAEKVLTEHARIGNNELSQFEAKEAAKQAEEFLQQQAQRVIEQGIEAGAQQSGADIVKQTMLEQLNTAGRFTPQVNDAYATLVGSYYANMAQRLGVTAEQLYARYPLKVEGEQQTGDQLDSVNQEERPVQGITPSADALVVPGRDEPVAPNFATPQALASSALGTPMSRSSGSLHDTAPSGRAEAGLLTQLQGAVAQGPRAQYTPDTLTISLLERADLSSFLHELGHAFLEFQTEIASQPGAPQQIVDDVNTVLKWFGGNATIEEWRAKPLNERRADHEKFAESFEEYLLEGKAPSTELQPLFTRFRSWLTNVYRSLSNFLALHGDGTSQLSPEVRGVFDRIIASEDEIRRAEEARTYAPLFKSAEQAGMAPEAWAAYQAAGAKATEAALANLESRSIKDMRWLTGARSRALKALQKDAAAKRKAIETEVENEVAAQPTYQAIRWLKTGRMVTDTGEEIRADKGFRISTEALAEMYPESGLGNPDMEKLKGMTAKNGMHPDLIAPLFGFESGDQLVRTVADAEPMASVIEGMTDQRVLERYGELGTEAGLQRAADEAVHNEARGRFIATELKALAEAGNARERTQRGGSVNVMVRAAKDFANRLIAQQKVRDVSPGKYTRAESRAGRLAEAALRKGETEEAITAQRDKLLNHYAAREAMRAQEEIERAVAYLKKFDKESVRSKLPSEYVDQIDKLLERVDLRRIPDSQARRRAKLATWIADQEAQGLEADIPDHLLEDVQLTPFREMTVEEIRGLVTTVEQIEHLGRLKSQLLTARDQREFSDVVDELTASVLGNSNGRRSSTRSPSTAVERALDEIRRFGAAHIKAATWARIFDGGKDGGVFWERFIRPANERADQEATMRAKATKDLTEIMAPVLKQKLGGSGTYFESIGRSLNKEGVLALALNTGNDSNLQRLLGGEGWTMDQIQPVLESMTADDWKTVQAIWDYFESYRPEIGAMERRVRGTEPAWVEPTERTVQTADGQTVTVRGGYYPVKYDPAASIRAEEHADAETAKRQLQNAYSAATVRRGFTKGRAEEVTGRPLLYSLKGVYDGVNDVIHYLSWQEWLIDANRLLRNQSIDTAIRSTYGPAAVKQLRTWRDAVAEGDSGSQEALDMALGKLRQSVSVAGLGFNVVSALMQPLGLTQSIVRVGAGWIGKGVGQYIAAPVARTKEVNEKSSFMANRARTRFRELNELRNKVQGQAKYQEYVGRYAYWLMMRFQQAVDVPTWLGAYEKAVATGNDEARSIALADQAVKDAQGGGQTLDLSAIERGGPAQKLFTVFYSFMNTALNLGVASKMTPTSKAKFAADMLLLYTVPAVLGSLLKDALTPGDAGDDDPEKLLKKLAGEQLSFLLGLVVVGREFAGVGKWFVSGERPSGYDGPVGLRAIGDVYDFATQAKQGEFDDAFRKALINLSGDLFGLPSAQINRTITGANALAAGETENPAALLTGYQKQP
jgi:hypothetical protein